MISAEYKTDLGPVWAKDRGNSLLFEHSLLRKNNANKKKKKRENQDVCVIIDAS